MGSSENHSPWILYVCLTVLLATFMVEHVCAVESEANTGIGKLVPVPAEDPCEWGFSLSLYLRSIAAASELPVVYEDGIWIKSRIPGVSPGLGLGERATIEHILNALADHFGGRFQWEFEEGVLYAHQKRVDGLVRTSRMHLGPLEFRDNSLYDILVDLQRRSHVVFPLQGREPLDVPRFSIPEGDWSVEDVVGLLFDQGLTVKNGTKAQVLGLLNAQSGRGLQWGYSGVKEVYTKNEKTGEYEWHYDNDLLAPQVTIGGPIIEGITTKLFRLPTMRDVRPSEVLDSVKKLLDINIQVAEHRAWGKETGSLESTRIDIQAGQWTLRKVLGAFVAQGAASFIEVPVLEYQLPKQKSVVHIGPDFLEKDSSSPTGFRTRYFSSVTAHAPRQDQAKQHEGRANGRENATSQQEPEETASSVPLWAVLACLAVCIGLVGTFLLRRKARRQEPID